MRYKIFIVYDMDQDDLNRELNKYYHFPLLNFAYVISEVLAGDSPFSKTIAGMKIWNIEKLIDEIKSFKRRIISAIDGYGSKILEIYPPHFVEEMKKLDKKDFRKALISDFDLNPFIDSIKTNIKSLEDINTVYKYKHKGSKLWPDKTKSANPFSYTNQISFLWAQKISDKNGAHWINIVNLISWFAECLEKADYSSKLFFHRNEDYMELPGESEGYPKVLKNQYRRIKKVYKRHILISTNFRYFPYVIGNPWIQRPSSVNTESLNFCSVISVKFYKAKIKSTFNEDGKLKVKETFFKQDYCNSRIREYDPDEEDSEKEVLLLNID